jgi:predicted AAA+ superfamily ATPase
MTWSCAPAPRRSTCRRGAAERLPGRRGAGRDYLVLPQTFAAFARAVDGSIPPSPRLTIADIRTPDGQAALHEARLHAPSLEDALSLYLRFGGLPAAAAEAATGAVNPSEPVKRVLYDSLVKEVQRRGASIPAAHALLERVLRSLGSRTDWSRMAREMDVPLTNRRGATSHHTLRDYIELLAGGYFSRPTGCTPGAPREPARSTLWQAHAASSTSSRSSTSDSSTYAAQPPLQRLTSDAQR